MWCCPMSPWPTFTRSIAGWPAPGWTQVSAGGDAGAVANKDRDPLYEDAIRTFDNILARLPRYEAARDARTLCYKRLQRQPPEPSENS